MPPGAALFRPEVLYRETEFEFEAILPCIVSSIVASSHLRPVFRTNALFFPGPVDFAPVELLPYAIFRHSLRRGGIRCGQDVLRCHPGTSFRRQD